MDAVAIQEAHFPLGRVDIYVDFRRIQVEEKESGGVLPLREGSMVAVAQTVVDGGAFDRPIIEKTQLQAAVGASETRFADESTDADSICSAVGGRKLD